LLNQAQNLVHAITSVEKLKGSGHTIILSCCPGTSSNRGDSQIICNGFIKYGVKDLYFYLRDGTIIQSSPTCLLDFFVEESMQRNGLGLQLFQKMLQVRGHRHFDFLLVKTKIFT
jgi:GNAT acetyltransferase, Mec-17